MLINDAEPGLLVKGEEELLLTIPGASTLVAAPDPSLENTVTMKHCGVAVKQEVSWCSASCLLSLLIVGLGEHSLLGLTTKCENSQVRGWK